MRGFVRPACPSAGLRVLTRNRVITQTGAFEGSGAGPSAPAFAPAASSASRGAFGMAPSKAAGVLIVSCYRMPVTPPV